MPRITKKTIAAIEELWKNVSPREDRQGKVIQRKVRASRNPETGRPLWEPDDVVEDNEKLTILLLRVWRAGRLADLPPELQEAAHQRIARSQGHGDKKTLRRARCGLEKGIKAPFSEYEVVKLYAAISKLAPGHSQTEVLSALQQKGLLDRRTSRQAFHKLLTRLDALHLFEN